MFNSVDMVILAGGQARRMGGCDKGLMLWQGKPLVEHLLERFAASCAKVLISCNRSEEQYARYNAVLVPDIDKQSNGPLAGVLAASRHSSAQYLFVCPCDTPKLPNDTLERLLAAMKDGIDLCFCNDGHRAQNLIMLVRREQCESIAAYLDRGDRSVMGWQESLSFIEVSFERTRDFDNFNRLEDLNEIKDS